MELARELGAKRLIFAMDVPGFYSDNPETNNEARLIDRISLDQLVKILKDMEQKGTADASGTVKGKLYSISTASDLISCGLEVTLVSMMNESNLTSFFKGQEVQCTRITND